MVFFLELRSNGVKRVLGYVFALVISMDYQLTQTSGPMSKKRMVTIRDLCSLLFYPLLYRACSNYFLKMFLKYGEAPIR